MFATLRFFAAFILFFVASLMLSAMELELPAFVIAEREDPDAHILFSRVVYNRQMFRDGSTVHGIGHSLMRYFRFEEINDGVKTTNCVHVYQIKNAHETTIHYCGLSPNEEKIVTTGHDNKIKIWRAHDGLLLYLIDGSCDLNKKINLAVFEGNNKIFIDYCDKSNKTWLLPPDSLLYPTKESHRLFAHLLKKYLAAEKNGEIKIASFQDFMGLAKENLINIDRILEDLDVDGNEYLQRLFYRGKSKL